MTLSRRDFIATSVFGAAAVVSGIVSGSGAEKRLLRRDSFFGMHFDLHPGKNDTVLGRDIGETNIEEFLRRVRPDYVQYDCKGHPGYAGYPTKAGTPSPGIVNDSLAVWRRVTARHNVALYIHYSGIWDGAACEQHPEWAAVRPDGTADMQKTSTFGPYVDKLLIPQLREAASSYDLDGAWVDGECWAVILDYSPAAAAEFSRLSGFKTPPKKPEDAGWPEFLEFNREQFRRYVRHYVEALHSSHPRFQIASNWLYSTLVPEKPELPVDFLSGDYLGNAAISTARLEARYLAATGKPWDLMAWGFQNSNDRQNHKPAVMLMQEASVVLAQGGGFQVYYVPSRAGHLEATFADVMEKVASFCRSRQASCHKSETVPQVGVLFSKNSLYSRSNKMFGGWGSASNPARGILDALVESHYSVDVVPDWSLPESAGRWPVIIVPDWADIGTAARDALVAYARGGGKLLVVGAETAGLFARELGAILTGSPGQETAYVKGKEVLGNITGIWRRVQPESAEAIEYRHPDHDTTRDSLCAATLVKCGAGSIAAIYGPLGKMLATYHSPALREFLDRTVRRLFSPTVEIDGPPVVETALRRKGSKFFVSLSNFAAMQVGGDYAINDFVPSIGPLRLSVALPARPRSVRLEPEGIALRGSWENGRWSGIVQKLDIHAVVTFE
jgi:hypothetical protein